MPCDIETTVDRARSLITTRVAGFIDIETVTRWRDDRAATIAQLRLPPNAHLSLFDVSEAKIQSQQVLAVFQSLIEDRGLASRKLAFALGGSAVGLQLRRVMKCRDAVACFDDVAAAEAWLLQPTERAQPPVRKVA